MLHDRHAQNSPITLMLIALAVALLAGCGRQPITPQVPLEPVIFRGMCDASGAVPLSEHSFAIADDEDNKLRIYDVNLGGEPLATYDLSASLGLYPKPSSKPGKPPKPPPELDIEGATLHGGLAYWITSHGRNRSGKYRAERLNFFATTLGDASTPIQVVGQVNETLLADLVADPRMATFGLAESAQKAPKEFGGLNIEGLTERRQGGVWIGFRNPQPQQKALIVALLNPHEVIRGQRAQFGEPLLLDLEGRGIRALSWWRGRYLIAAGSFAGDEPSALYTWDGANKLEQLPLPPGQIANPEAFFTPEDRADIMFFNDQGTTLIEGTECKRLKDPEKKFFTGVWLRL